MAAATFTSFTITQPFLGAALQFHPALGSKELEQLIDAYVTGPASKRDKLSQVTMEFYQHAIVDISTGALFRQYNVVVSSWTSSAFEESPTQSQSSCFSPPFFTPSPGSFANLADSGYGSVSMTPPTQNRRARVSKKPKKDLKKAAEVRLPGFSILTKDGIDVTTSAGRGTKTKEQREHAHLMRIMKACDECKRKKIRCDPSHRRQNTEMSRTSTSTTKSSISSNLDPSPTVSVPSLSHEKTWDSQSSMPSFGTSSIDDFVLFPDDASFWNPADMSPPEFDSQDCDLNQFNFDINDIDLTDLPTMSVDQSFDFPSFEQSSFQLGRSVAYHPFEEDVYALHQWAQPTSLVSHTRPHPSTSSQDPVQLESSWFEPGFPASDVSVSLRWTSGTQTTLAPESPGSGSESQGLTFTRVSPFE